MKKKEKMAKCQNCGKERKLIAYVGEGSMMDYIHGNYQMWCKECIVKAQLKYARQVAKRIPKLQEKLEKIEKEEK